jgi:hypothetical protein
LLEAYENDNLKTTGILMNKINRFTQTLLAGAVAMGLLAAAARANADTIQQAIVVLKVSGGARYSMDGGKTFSMLNKGDVLQPGTMIQTADRSTVDLMLGEPRLSPLASPVSVPGVVATSSFGGGGSSGESPKANVIHIFPNSVLSVDKLTMERTGMDEVSETQLDLKAGRILGNVKKLSAASRYEIKVPNGVAGIRGTGYMADANGTIYVFIGSMVFSYLDAQGNPQVVTITAGQMFNPSQPTPAPMPIPPDVIALFTSILDSIPGQPGPVINPPTPNISFVSPL